MEPFPNPADRSRDAEDEIFAEATELPSGEREAFVQRRSGGDSELVRSVLALLAQYDRLGSFLGAPAVPARAVPTGGADAHTFPGAVLAGRFRLCEQLGQGGMGVVYRAEDPDVGEFVALKMVRDIWLDDPAVPARFREEIRLARKIAHHNVCRIHELFTDAFQGRPRAFITMEYYEGRSLAQLLASGWKPDAAEILAITRGIAAGLEAAHDAGIIHRDLKPANIMMCTASGVAGSCRAWRPVIMDFGLAQALASEGGSVTRTGQIIGSPDYMAPEQFLGEPVTPASDVFSFAVIIYEMATGTRPWPGEGLIQTALRRLGGVPATLACGPNMPVQWNDILAGALARDPAARPQRPGDLILQLDALAVPVRVPVRRRRLPLPSRRTALVGAGIAAVSGIAALYRLTDTDAAFSGDPVLMLTPVKSFAGYANGRGLDFLIRTQVRQSGHVKLADSTNAAPLPPGFTARDARQAALFAGARFVLLGGISRPADDYKLELELQELGAGPEHPRKTFAKQFQAGDDKELTRTARDVGVWIRTTLQEAPVDIANRSYAPEDLTTDNWRALQEFLQADEAWREGPQGPRAAESIRSLQSALSLDPQFALAAARLGDRLVSMGQEDEGLQYQRMGVTLMDQRNLKDRESLRIRGNYYQDTGQDESAERLFAEWAQRYPGDGLPLFYRATSLMRLGREEEAASQRAVAARLEPGNLAIRRGAAMALLEAGRLSEAERACAALKPGDDTDQILGGIAFGRYDLQGVRDAIERMRVRGSLPYQCKAWALRACLLAEENNWDEAENAIDNGIQLAVGATLPASVLANKLIRAQLLIRRNRNGEAVRECRALRETIRGVLSTLRIGCLLARAGDVPGAASCAPIASSQSAGSLLLAMPHIMHWRLRLEAEVHLAKGNARQALRTLESCPPPSTIDEWPEYKARAAIAAEDGEGARSLISRLLGNPGRFWYQADVTGPGFFRWALDQSAEKRSFQHDFPSFLSLNRMLKQ